MKKILLMAALCTIFFTGCSMDTSINTVQTEDYADSSVTGDSTAESAVKDGSYQCAITLTGGSGKATVNSPADVVVENGNIYVTLIWSSKNYDYMLVDGVKYNNEAPEGENSVFTVPVPGFGQSYTVIGDTTAMSTPHEIEYLLTVYAPGEEVENSLETAGSSTTEDTATKSIELEALEYTGSLEL
ncbi:MAG: hypothetical protein K6A23_13415, partial [Butyrivibrio sp.]|nr:hypothetical protein [Butyrivibrio sp.]